MVSELFQNGIKMVTAHLLVAVDTTTQGVLFAPNLLPSRVRVRGFKFQLFAGVGSAGVSTFLVEKLERHLKREKK
jgi:hypothetical protein